MRMLRLPHQRERSAPSGAPVLPLAEDEDGDEEYDDSPEYDLDDALIVDEHNWCYLR